MTDQTPVRIEGEGILDYIERVWWGPNRRSVFGHYEARYAVNACPEEWLEVEWPG